MKVLALVVLLLGLPFRALAQDASTEPVVIGVAALHPGVALAWTVSHIGKQTPVRFWTVRAAGKGNAAQWKAVSVPPVLETFLHTYCDHLPDLNEASELNVGIEAHNGVIKMLWTETPEESSSTSDALPTVIHQATSVNDGRTWTTTRSVVQGNMQYQFIGGYAEADQMHALLLVTADGGAGMLPAGLFATSDGGAHWRLSATDGPDKIVPLGRGVAMLHFADARHAWMVGRCSFCEDDADALTGAYTTDGGTTWHNAPLAASYRGCPDCYVFSYMESEQRPECFDADVNYGPEGAAEQAMYHFCTADLGKTWDGPIEGATSKEQDVLPTGFEAWYREARSTRGREVWTIVSPRKPDDEKTHTRLLYSADGGRSMSNVQPPAAVVRR